MAAAPGEEVTKIEVDNLERVFSVFMCRLRFFLSQNNMKTMLLITGTSDFIYSNQIL